MASSRRWAATVANSPERIGIMFVRVIVGAVFLLHGYQKWFVMGHDQVEKMFSGFGIPSASVSAYVAMSAETLCGALLILGFLTRVAAIPIVAVMVVAILKVHLVHGFFISYSPVSPGYEYALTLGLAALALVFTGSGALAADNFLS